MPSGLGSKRRATPNGMLIANPIKPKPSRATTLSRRGHERVSGTGSAERAAEHTRPSSLTQGELDASL